MGDPATLRYAGTSVVYGCWVMKMEDWVDLGKMAGCRFYSDWVVYLNL